MDSTTKSAPLAYTCWPERRGLSITMVGANDLQRHFPHHFNGDGHLANDLHLHFANALLGPGDGGIGGGHQAASWAACIWAALPLRTATGRVRWWRKAAISRAKSMGSGWCWTCCKSMSTGSLSKKSGSSAKRRAEVGNHLLDLGAAQSHGQHRQFGAFQVERVDSTGSISGHVYVKDGEEKGAQDARAQVYPACSHRLQAGQGRLWCSCLWGRSGDNSRQLLVPSDRVLRLWCWGWLFSFCFLFCF